MTRRAMGFLAGAVAMAFAAGAVRLAAADPLAAPERGRPPRAARPARTAVPVAASASAAAPAGRWTARKRSGVSAGVLVRAASRRPLERGPSCPPSSGPREAPRRCAPESARGEPIEIDWHAERPAP